MSRKRGRPERQYRLRARTMRRDPIDFAALARAALEQAAMNQQRDASTSLTDKNLRRLQPVGKGAKDVHHDRLA